MCTTCWAINCKSMVTLFTGLATKQPNMEIGLSWLAQKWSQYNTPIYSLSPAIIIMKSAFGFPSFVFICDPHGKCPGFMKRNGLESPAFCERHVRRVMSRARSAISDSNNSIEARGMDRCGGSAGQPLDPSDLRGGKLLDDQFQGATQSPPLSS